MGRDRARQSRGPEASAGTGPTVAAHLPRLVLEGTVAAGGDAQRVARRLALDPETLVAPDARVSLHKERCLWPEAAKAAGDDNFGMRLGMRQEPGKLDVFDYVWRNAPTVGDALICAARYLPLLHDVAQMEVEDAGDAVHLHYTFRGETAPLERQMVEYTFTSMVAMARRATGNEELGPTRVAFQHRPPSGYRELASGLGTREVEFRARLSGMTWAKAMLSQPILHADVSLGAILRRHADALLAARPRTASMQEHITDLLLRSESRYAPSLEEIARRLHLGARTLQRRLADEGLTFHDVVERARFESATQLLLNGVNVADIAERLRYADVRAFRRAFIRWTGVTPQAYRQTHAPRLRPGGS